MGSLILKETAYFLLMHLRPMRDTVCVLSLCAGVSGGEF